MWLCLLLFCSYSNAIYLPVNNSFVNESIGDPGPVKIKLDSPSKSSLALTSVLIMGSAGVTVVYILCIFIVCMRNEEEGDEISDTQLTQHRMRLENSQEIPGQESEPLMLQFYATNSSN